jgi:hypothetical protein
MIFATLLFSSLLSVHIYNITDYKKYKKIKNILPKMYVTKYGDLVNAREISYFEYLDLK